MNTTPEKKGWTLPKETEIVSKDNVVGYTSWLQPGVERTRKDETSQTLRKLPQFYLLTFLMIESPMISVFWEVVCGEDFSGGYRVDVVAQPEGEAGDRQGHKT